MSPPPRRSPPNARRYSPAVREIEDSKEESSRPNPVVEPERPNENEELQLPHLNQAFEPEPPNEDEGRSYRPCVIEPLAISPNHIRGPPSSRWRPVVATFHSLRRSAKEIISLALRRSSKPGEDVGLSEQTVPQRAVEKQRADIEDVIEEHIRKVFLQKVGDDTLTPFEKASLEHGQEVMSNVVDLVERLPACLKQEVVNEITINQAKYGSRFVEVVGANYEDQAAAFFDLLRFLEVETQIKVLLTTDNRGKTPIDLVMDKGTKDA